MEVVAVEEVADLLEVLEEAVVLVRAAQLVQVEVLARQERRGLLVQQERLVAVEVQEQLGHLVVLVHLEQVLYQEELQITLQDSLVQQHYQLV